MTAISNPLNTATESVDALVLSTGTTGVLKRAVAGSSRSVSGGTSNAAAQEVGTHTDDAAATLAADAVVGIGALAHQTSPDSVDEGDVGLVRMTLDRLLRVVSQQRSNAATKANVSGSASSVTILAANALRTGASVWNDSTAILYLDLTGGTASTTSCSVKLIADAYFEVPYGLHSAITGIWATATGAARVTEYTAP